MYVGLKQPRGDGERYVTPARAAAKETKAAQTKERNVSLQCTAKTGKSLNRQNGFITTLERLSCHRHFKITQAQTKVSFFYLNLYYKLNLERFSNHFYTFS